MPAVYSAAGEVSVATSPNWIFGSFSSLLLSFLILVGIVAALNFSRSKLHVP